MQIKNIQPWIIKDAKRHDTDWENALRGKDPVVLFMGGLLHLNDTANGPTLFNRLELMTGLEANPGLDVRLVSLSEKDPGPDSIMNNLEARHKFNMTGEISSHAKEITEGFILPNSVTGDLTGDALVDAVKMHFTRISLIGFSAGTSMIQQCEILCQNRLAELGLSEQEISSSLNSLVAFSLGPVSFPSKAKSGFAKMLCILEGDNIAKKARDWSLYTDPAKQTGIAVTSHNRSIVLADTAGDTQERALQIIPSTIPGIPGSYKVILKHDGEGHSVFVYTNTRELIHGKNTITYASSPSALATRAYIGEMVKLSVEATQNRVHRDGEAFLRDFETQTLSVKNIQGMIEQYKAERKEFEQLIISPNPYDSYNKIEANINSLKNGAGSPSGYTPSPPTL